MGVGLKGRGSMRQTNRLVGAARQRGQRSWAAFCRLADANKLLLEMYTCRPRESEQRVCMSRRDRRRTGATPAQLRAERLHFKLRRVRLLLESVSKDCHPNLLEPWTTPHFQKTRSQKSKLIVGATVMHVVFCADRPSAPRLLRRLPPHNSTPLTDRIPFQTPTPRATSSGTTNG